MRKQSPGSRSRGVKHMWHEDCTRRQRHGCPVGHLLWSCSQDQEAHPQKVHRKNDIFKMPGPQQHSFPLGTPQHIPASGLQMHSVGLPEPIVDSTTPCRVFVGVQIEATRVEVATAWLNHRPKIITLPYLGPSPQAAQAIPNGEPITTPHRWRPVREV